MSGTALSGIRLSETLLPGQGYAPLPTLIFEYPDCGLANSLPCDNPDSFLQAFSLRFFRLPEKPLIPLVATLTSTSSTARLVWCQSSSV